MNFSDDTSSDEEYEPNVEEEEDLSETEVEEDMIVTNPNEGECVTGSRSSTPMPDEEMQVMEAPSTTAIESTPMSGAVHEYKFTRYFMIAVFCVALAVGLCWIGDTLTLSQAKPIIAVHI